MTLEPFPELATHRLRLRELTARDRETMLAIYSDRAHMRWSGGDILTELEQAERLIQMFAEWRRAPSPGLRWGLVRQDTGMLIGSCGLSRINHVWHNAVVGYELAADACGQGFMREALATILDFGFRELGLHRVQAEIHPKNRPSIRLVASLGFQHEGRHREQGYWDGRYHDLDCYALLEADWQRGVPA